jgi:hypothetical protein
VLGGYWVVKARYACDERPRGHQKRGGGGDQGGRCIFNCALLAARREVGDGD